MFIGNPYARLDRLHKKKLHIVLSDRFDKELVDNPICEFVPVYNETNILAPVRSNTSILPVNRLNLGSLADNVKKIGDFTLRINLKFTDVGGWEKSDFELYREQLNYLNGTLRQKLSVISHTGARTNSCKAGVSEFTLAPNGKLYYCAGYYYLCPENSICEVDSIDLIKAVTTTLHDHTKSAKCNSCKNTHCEQCSLQNLLLNGFDNLPAEEFCNVSNITLDSNITGLP